MSSRTFYREWKKCFSVTPGAYRIEKQLENACRFLSETEMSVAEIADACGFTGAVYFHQIFRKRYGMSPLSYRRLKRKSFILTQSESMEN